MIFMGIYKIKNVVTGQLYIGSSTDLHRRSNDHFSALRKNKGRHPRLQESWNQYGETAFVFEVMEIVHNPENLREREQFWIDTLNPELNTSINSRGGARARWEFFRQDRIKTGKVSNWYHRYELIAPDGRQMCTDNLSRFCEEYGLTLANMQAVARGKIRFSNGWRVRNLDNPIELKSPIHLKKKSKKYRGYLLTDPNGVQVCTDNLTAFCDEFELTRENLLKVARGQRKVSQGWTCEFIMG